MSWNVNETIDLLRQCPTSADEWFKQGISFYKKNMLDESIECCKEVLKIKPQHFAAWYQTGIVYLDLGEPEKALIAFEEALLLDPKCAKAWAGKGNALCKLSRYEEV